MGLSQLFAVAPHGSRRGASLEECQLPADFGGRLLAMFAVNSDDRLPGRAGDSSIGKGQLHSLWRVVYGSEESDNVGHRWCHPAVDQVADSKTGLLVAYSILH